MKIAVLIAGYIRTFDRTYLNLLEFIKLNDNHEFDFYFLILIDKNEVGKRKDINLLNEKIKIINNIPNLRLLIKSEKGDQWGNIFKLFCEFNKFKDDNKLDYDLMIKSRFDNNVNRYKIKNKSFYEKNVIVPKYYFYGMSSNLKCRKSISNTYWKINPKSAVENYQNNYIINDRFAIGICKDMYIYFETGKFFKEIMVKMRNVNKQCSTEGILAYHLKNNNVSYKHDSDLITTIIRK